MARARAALGCDAPRPSVVIHAAGLARGAPPEVVGARQEWAAGSPSTPA
jgi:hypothetical protein